MLQGINSGYNDAICQSVDLSCDLVFITDILEGVVGILHIRKLSDSGCDEGSSDQK
jgi:hypothetical protein